MFRTGVTLCTALAVILSAAPGASAATLAGDLDPGFGTGGLLAAGPDSPSLETARAMAIQPDGRIIVAGRHTSAAGDADFAVARHLPDGGLDPTFGAGGVAVTKVTANGDYVETLAIDLSGRILVAGSTETAAGGDVAVTRYEPDGDPDPNFSGDGKVIVNVTPGDDQDRSHSVIPLSGGKIVVVGTSLVDYSDGSDTTLVRLTSAGAPDGTFHTDGSHVIDLAQPFPSTSAAPAPGGKFVVAGTYGSGLGQTTAVMRFKGAHELDDTFSGDGIAAASSGESYQLLNTVTVTADGAVVAAGFAPGPTGENEDVVVRRFEPDGDPDPSFGKGGLVTTPVGQGDVNDRAEAVAVQPDGRIVVAGYNYGDSGRQAFVVRYLPGGALDPAFAGDGIATFAVGDPAITPTSAKALALAASGRIVLGGRAVLAPGAERRAVLFGVAAVDGPPDPVPAAPDGGEQPAPDAPITPATPTATDLTAPLLTAASVRTRRRRPTLRFTLSEAATVTATVRRRRVSKARGAGRNVLRLRKLRRGRYVLRVVAVDAAGNRSRVRKLRFRVRG